MIARRRQMVRPWRRVVGWLCGGLPAASQKRLIMQARRVGLLCISDADSMIAERGLRGF